MSVELLVFITWLICVFIWLTYTIYSLIGKKIKKYINNSIKYIIKYFIYKNFYQTISYYELRDIIDIGKKDLYVIDIFDKEYVYMKRKDYNDDLEKYCWKDFLWIKNISLERRNERLIDEVKKSIYNKDKERFMIYQETMKEIEQIGTNLD